MGESRKPDALWSPAPHPPLRCTLRAGTRFYVEENGRQSAARVLERSTDVTPVCLALNPGEFGVYALDDGSHIFVKFEDEVRGQDG